MPCIDELATTMVFPGYKSETELLWVFAYTYTLIAMNRTNEAVSGITW